MKIFFMMTISIALWCISATFFDETIFIAPLLISLGLYLFIYALIKLCKKNKKIKEIIYSFFMSL